MVFVKLFWLKLFHSAIVLILMSLFGKYLYLENLKPLTDENQTDFNLFSSIHIVLSK
jgi:putative exporter of polyketide antibiotics